MPVNNIQRLRIRIIYLFLLIYPALLTGQTGKLRGFLNDAVTGHPIQNVQVTLDDVYLSATTDSSGNYILLGVPVGEHTVTFKRSEYTTTYFTEVRIHINQTTTLDIDLYPGEPQDIRTISTSDIPFAVQAEFNHIKIQTQDDFQHLAIRGFKNILALNAGTVLQDGILHIRGGHPGEIAYRLDGASTTSLLSNTSQIPVIQEAIQEIQMHPGFYSAEYGGTHAGLVQTVMKTGGSSYKATFDYRTDDFAHSGEQFLGTSSFGYHNAVATVGGPVPHIPRMRFFLAGQHKFMRQRNPSFIEPFNTDDFINRLTGRTVGESGGLVDDGIAGRDHGEPLPNGGVVKYDRNSLPGSWVKETIIQGNILYTPIDKIRLKFTGSYHRSQNPTEGVDFYTHIRNVYFNPDRIPLSMTESILGSFRLTHSINEKTFYEISVFGSSVNQKTYDKNFKDNWKVYTDSLKNAELGYTDWRWRYYGPADHSTIYNFEMEPCGSPTNSYDKKNQVNYGGSLDFTSQLTSHWELKVGGQLDMGVIRRFSVGSIRDYMWAPYSWDGDLPRDWKGLYGDEWEYRRMVDLASAGNVDFSGYDIDGNEWDDESYGPDKPVFGSAYIQNKFEYQDLILDVGIRYELADLNALRTVEQYVVPETGERKNGAVDPWMDSEADWLDPHGVCRTKAHHFFLPRLNISFPVTSRTSFYASYGKFIQMPPFTEVSRGYRSLSMSVSPETRSPYGFWNNYVGYTAEPEIIEQFEVGFKQTFLDRLLLSLRVFQRENPNQLRMERIFTGGIQERTWEDVIFSGYRNEDYSQSKGIELGIELLRLNGISAIVNYTLADVRGTGSTIHTNRIVTSDAGIVPGVEYYRYEWDPMHGFIKVSYEPAVARYPSQLYLLDHHQRHRGSIILDYRLNQKDVNGIFKGCGLNALLTFNSGHPFTLIAPRDHVGSIDVWKVGVMQLRDRRESYPIEPVNASTTPWFFNLDLTLDKIFNLGPVNFRLYATVLNVLNTKQVINVYPTTGGAETDGWLNSTLSKPFLNIPYFGAFYEAINMNNSWGYNLATGNSLWGHPRQIRMGLEVEFR